MLDGKTIRLCGIERHDMLQNYHWGNQRELIHFTGMPPYPKSAADIDRWFETGTEGPNFKIYAIKEHDGSYLGNIELREIDHQHGRAEIGLFLGDPLVRNRGRGREAIELLTGFAFDEMRLNRLYAKILEYNQPARSAFERCGYRLEGQERQAHYHQGAFHDICTYGLLSSEHRKKEAP